MAIELIPPLPRYKTGTPVKRDNGFTKEEKNFFLSWLNGGSLENLINFYPGEGDIKFPLKCPHLWYSTREDIIDGSPQFGFKEPEEIILFNNEEDRQIALKKFPRIFSRTAVKGDEIFSNIGNIIEFWRHRHINIFNFYMSYGKFFLPDIRGILTKYNRLIEHYINDDGQLQLRLSNPRKNNLLDWIEVNFMLRAVVEPEKGVLSGLRICECCDKYYFAASDKAIYCSSNCRSKQHKKKKKSLALEK